MFKGATPRDKVINRNVSRANASDMILLNSPGRFALLLLLGLCTLTANLSAQTEPKREQIDVDHADVLEIKQLRPTGTRQRLIGNVELSQDSVYMYCDSAVLENQVELFAEGNVTIQQGDSTSAFSDSLFYNASDQVANLIQNVVLVNGDRKLFTERLVYNLGTKLATYTDGALLTNGETQLSSKRGYYYVEERQIFFRDSVVVIDPRFEMRADTLQYATDTEIVYFLGPTIFRSDSSEIYCEAGFYDVQNNLAEFRQNAQYQKGAQRASADKILYDGNVDVYVLEGDARFAEGERRLATGDRIRYDERNDVTELEGDAFFRDSTRTIQAAAIRYDAKREVYTTLGRSLISDPPNLLEADSVDYREENGLGLATGNVVWRDTAADLSIFCAKAAYNQNTGYLKASGGRNGRPLLVTMVDGDSLYLTSDTLFSQQVVPIDTLPVDTLGADTVLLDSTIVELPASDSLRSEATAAIIQAVDTLQFDSIYSELIVLDTISADTVSPDTPGRQLFAYRDVRIFKKDLQAICDSLAYSTADSTFRLFRDPVIWSDTSQFVADTVDLLLANQKLDRIYLRQRGFIITSPDSIFFNQIKGKRIEARFDSNELRDLDVRGNAEAIYYALDEAGAYVGVNKTACSEMLIQFEEGQVNTITFLQAPSGSLDPMGEVDHEAIKLEGYEWRTQGRPWSLDALFEPKQMEPKVELRPKEEDKTDSEANKEEQ